MYRIGLYFSINAQVATPVRLTDTLVMATSLNLRSVRQEIRAPRTGSGTTKSFGARTERAANRLSIELSFRRAT